MKIIIDTREQSPWHFGDLAEVSRGTLPTGDYALAGDTGFAIERKSLPDYVQTITSNWQRFRRELDRMKRFPVRVVIVEGEWMDILTGKYPGNVPPPAIIARTSEMIMDGVTILFCSNSTAAAGLCWRLLVERKKRLEA
jgi:ERCC4-type nuclease